jgi:hypothetical protein
MIEVIVWPAFLLFWIFRFTFGAKEFLSIEVRPFVEGNVFGFLFSFWATTGRLGTFDVHAIHKLRKWTIKSECILHVLIQ